MKNKIKNIFNNITDFCLFIWRKSENIFYEIKWFIQKISRLDHHCSDSDLIDLDCHLAKIIYKKLKAFRNTQLKCECFSFPCDLKNENEWMIIINKMLFSFKLILDGKIIEDNNFLKYEEGMFLFAKYFRSLWL